MLVQGTSVGSGSCFKEDPENRSPPRWAALPGFVVCWRGLLLGLWRWRSARTWRYHVRTIRVSPELFSSLLPGFFIFSANLWNRPYVKEVALACCYNNICHHRSYLTVNIFAFPEVFPFFSLQYPFILLHQSKA